MISICGYNQFANLNSEIKT